MSLRQTQVILCELVTWWDGFHTGRCEDTERARAVGNVKNAAQRT
jgi:hypothetical protein